jgi:4-amino-4-deoxy-L-arabinose transferase-like glycosyltransferase
MIKWLEGKKTYIAAAAIAIAAGVFFFLNRLSAPDFTMALGAAASIAGLSAKLNRYLPDIVQGLEDVKAKNYGAAAGIAVKDAIETKG